MRRPRLKTYLFVSLTLVTAGPLMTLGAVQVARWRSAAQRDADRELTLAAQALARAIGQSVDANVRALETSAGELEVHPSTDPKVLQQIVETHRRRFTGLAVVNLAGPDGRTIASDPISDPQHGSYLGRDYSDRAYYRAMLRTGRTGISEVEIGKVSGVPAIHAKTPIHATAGSTTGAIAGSMGFALALEHLQTLTADVTSNFVDLEAQVVDHRSRLIIESDPRGRPPLRDLTTLAIYRAPPASGVVLSDAVDEHGVAVRAAVTRVTEQALDWTVAVTRSRESIARGADRARVMVLVALATALVAGLLLAFGLASWFARPIIDLEAYATKVRAGARSPAPPATARTTREVAGLIGAVEFMVRDLQARNEELEALRDSLEERIRTRTHELARRTREMRLVLDNLAEGVFIMDRQGVIGSEHSRQLEVWFGPSHPGDTFHRYIGRSAPSFSLHGEIGWEQVMDDTLGLEVALGQLPARLEVAGRHYALSYRAIGDGGNGASDDLQFLVVITDVTSDIERERMLVERKEGLTLIEYMLSDRAGLITFIEEASAIVARALAGDSGGETLRRDLHTLKGASLSFGIETVGGLCHQLETAMADGDPSWRDGLLKLGERWGRVAGIVDRLLGTRRDFVEMSPDQFEELERAGRDGASRDELLGLIRALRLDPIERRLQRLARQADEIAGRLEKQVIVEVRHDDARVDARRWAPFWAAFVHALRNAIDHGIEKPDERVARGKPAAGYISLRARREGSGVVVELEDDGRGIDWEAIRRAAAARGVAIGAHDDPNELLFADGVSTAAQVTQLSGRGVGLGALRAVVRAMGGTIQVQTTQGAGTRLTVRVPSP